MTDQSAQGVSRPQRTEEQIARNPYWHDTIKPHAISAEDIEELCFNCMNIVLSSYGAANLEGSYSDGKLTPFAPKLFSLHHRYAETALSKELLKLSIFIRALDDLLSLEKDYIEITNLIPKDLGIVFEGNFQLNLRECCNKIIHAYDVRPVYRHNDQDGDEERWHMDGTLELIGKKNGDEWSITIFIYSFLEAVLVLIFELEERGYFRA